MQAQKKKKEKIECTHGHHINSIRSSGGRRSAIHITRDGSSQDGWINMPILFLFSVTPTTPHHTHTHTHTHTYIHIESIELIYVTQARIRQHLHD